MNDIVRPRITNLALSCMLLVAAGATGATGALGVPGAVSQACAAEDEAIPATRVTAKTTIAALPQVVWNALTSGRDMAEWCPHWHVAYTKDTVLSELGDSVAYRDDWGNTGLSFVTFIEPNVELRVVHEPDNGTYMAQSKVTLVPKGLSTELVYVEQYTDEDKEKGRAQTVRHLASRMESSLEEFKKRLENQ